MNSAKSALAYVGLLALSLGLGVAAVLTLIPASGAPWPNIMGYSSLCTFAPGATFACALLAGITCMIRARLIKKVRTPLLGPIIVLGLLVAGVTISTIAWAGEKAKYAEATTAASAEE